MFSGHSTGRVRPLLVQAHAVLPKFSPSEFQRDSSLRAVGDHRLQLIQDSGGRPVLLDQHPEIQNLSQLADMVLERAGCAAELGRVPARNDAGTIAFGSCVIFFASVRVMRSAIPRDRNTEPAPPPRTLAHIRNRPRQEGHEDEGRHRPQLSQRICRVSKVEGRTGERAVYRNRRSRRLSFTGELRVPPLVGSPHLAGLQGLILESYEDRRLLAAGEKSPLGGLRG